MKSRLPFALGASTLLCLLAACSANDTASKSSPFENDASDETGLLDSAAVGDTAIGAHDVGLGDSGGGVDSAPSDIGNASDTLDAGSTGLPIGCTVTATTDLNLRSGPSTSDAILTVIPNGDTATLAASAPNNGFYEVTYAGMTGWASAKFLDTSACVTAPTDAGSGTGTVADVEAIAAGSTCESYSWLNRGKAPSGYIPGVAVVFGRAVCNQSHADVAIVSRAASTDTAHDALAWYASIYSGLGMSNATAGVDTLRHTYTLLIGLGMRESTGEYCTGRDTTATNETSDNAEAGGWQTSYDSHTLDPNLPLIFAKYRTSDVGCLLGEFSTGVTCSAANWQNWGTGVDGIAFQDREKKCPAFAAEYAAVMLRVSGGSLGHYGPLRAKAAEVRTECDAMLQKVEAYVGAHPGVCGVL